jgi:hypothetical protein
MNTDSEYLKQLKNEPFGGSKFDYQKHKTKAVKPEQKSVAQELGIYAFGRIEKKESE